MRFVSPDRHSRMKLMKRIVQAIGICCLSAPAFAAPLTMPGAASAAAARPNPLASLPSPGGGSGASSLPSPGNPPLPPVSVDLGFSGQGSGKPSHPDLKPTTLPGLAEIIPYYDNGGKGGTKSADLEVDTNGKPAQYGTVIATGLLSNPAPTKLSGNVHGEYFKPGVDPKTGTPALNIELPPNSASQAPGTRQ